MYYNRITALFLLLFLFSFTCLSQIPGHFMYQSILRDSNGDPLADQQVNLKISIIKTSESGEVVYSETHLTTTTSFGLVNLGIGTGTVVTGNFSSIDWSGGPFYIRVEVDPQGGTTFTDMGTVSLSSVPYAMFSDVNHKIRVMTSEQRDALEDPSAGMMILNSSTNCINYFTGAFWYEYCGDCIPQPSCAGDDQINVCSPVQMDGNTPSAGTGTWSVLSGSGGSFTDVNDPVTDFSGTYGISYELAWTITSLCGSSSDTVEVEFMDPPTTADAGDDQLNLPGNSITLQGNTPSVGSGLWLIISGSGGTLTDPTDPGTLFTGASETTYILRWRISTACDTTYDDVTISFSQSGGGDFTCGDDFIDTRDGKSYETVIIGTQCWMKENLNVGTRIDGSQNQTDNSLIEKYCYNDYEDSCDVYGGLYQWNELMDYATGPGLQGICPDAWHVPTKNEWDTLNNYVSWSSNALKAVGQGSGNGAGTNTSGFTALLGGHRSGSGFGGIHEIVGFWNSNAQTDTYSYRYNLSGSNDVISGGVTQRIYGLSVRCIWDSIPEIPPTTADAGPDQLNLPDTVTNLAGNTPEYGTGLWTIASGAGGVLADSSSPASQFSGLEGNIYELAWTISNSFGSSSDTVIISFALSSPFGCGGLLTDTRDGQTYETVLIDTLCWMAENLNIGTVIDNGTDQTDNGIIEKYCSYNGIEDSCDVYGGLYQWNEMMQYSITPGIQGICPQGWHLPTDDEWKALEGAVDSQYDAGNTEWNGLNEWRGYDAGKKLKSTSGWANNGNGTDDYGFSVIPNTYQGDWSWIWTSSEYDGSSAIGRKLDYAHDEIFRRESSKTYGDVVRCVNNCSPQPTSADAGPDQPGLQDTVTTLAGNTPTNGEGVWSVVNGTGGVIADSTDAESSFSGLADNSYDLTWTITNACGSSTDTVTISFAPGDGIKKVMDDVALDGALDESFWNMTRAITIPNNGSSDNTALFNALWDENYLYVGAMVTDATICNNRRCSWYDDGIEICLDGNYSQGSDFDDHDMQFIKPVLGYWIQEMNEKNNNVIHRWQMTDDGYTMEFAIPWSEISITPSSGDTIGFNIVMNDDDNCSYAHNLPSQLLWEGTGQYYTNPSLWGFLVLTEDTASYSDDYIAVVDPNGYDFLINGTSFDINWVSKGVDHVDIEYSTNNGSTWNSIASDISAGTGSYSWSVDATTSENCKIRISNSDSTDLYDISLHTFTISDALTGVEPLVNDIWHVYQWPYNAYYPEEPAGINGHLGNACGPTALARIIHYWEYPIVGNDQLTFTDNAGYSWSANFGATTYNYDNMPASLPGNSTEDEYTDVATLFYHTAVSMNDYWGSGTNLANMSYAMEHYFRYTESQVATRKDYSRDEWITMLKNQLDSNRVMLVQGNTLEILGNWHEGNNIAGHWYLCDGYNDEGKFHVRLSFGDADTYYDVNNFSGFAYNIGVLRGLEPELDGKELSLTSPDGNEVFIADTDTVITWSSSNVSDIKIEYTLDNGEIWNEIIASTPASAGSYTWSLPDTTSYQCKVKVTDVADVNVYDKSDDAFTITPYELVLLNPNGGECYAVGSIASITWESTPVDSIEIEYTTDNGTTWYEISDSTSASSGSYEWLVPDSASTQCKIKITDKSNASVYDESDGNFEITGETSYALEFDGTNDYASITSIPFPSDDLTIEAWIKPDDFENYQEIVFWYGTHGVQFRTQSDSSLLYGESAGSWNYVVTNSKALMPGEWNHVAITKELDNCDLYINGVHKASSQFDNDPSVSDITIGGRGNNMDRFFDGTIDEVRIWTVARTQNEILENMYHYLTGSVSGLYACWRMNEGTGQSIMDVTDNDYDGQLGSSSGSDDNDPAWVTTSWPYGSGGGFNCGDLLSDPRDGTLYETVQIGSQCWMAENLNIGTMISGTSEQTDNSVIEKYCYDDEADSCDVYGGLYQWDETMQYATDTAVQGICPPGWHIPTDYEWMILEGNADSQYGVGDPIWETEGWRGYDAGKNLKSATGWNGTDLYGFDALPAGRRMDDGSFGSVGSMNYHWISVEYENDQGWSRYLRSDLDNTRRGHFYKTDGRTVRCLKD